MTISTEIRLTGNTIIATGTARDFPCLADSKIAIQLAFRRKDSASIKTVEADND